MCGAGLTVEVHDGPVLGEQPGCQRPVLRGLGMPDRLGRVSVRGEPVSGFPVQHGRIRRRRAAQFQPRQVGEQPVVAKPRPGRVHCRHEGVRLLQISQDPLATAAPGEQIGQLPVDSPEQGRPQQQLAHRAGLPFQHLAQQVLGDGPFTAGELRHQPLRVRVPGKGQRCEPQPRRPALGPFPQASRGGRRHRHPGRSQQLTGLLQREPQVGRTDLGQLTVEPHAVQPQPDLLPGDEDEPQRGRCPHDQQFQLPMCFG
ncbi:hypothetical protein AOZ06_24880 [Kibdelosporangium phytohabitans]|uniref:Uncharacterized protein n=1 Tax=Kibdelosporangium phytohabitans TaxID=860235 RepID=A0A0N9I548_9PSEU|nr:hypothetical protein AOZ06_24880 [Kibdelosporangium phytohabitans]